MLPHLTVANHAAARCDWNQFVAKAVADWGFTDHSERARMELMLGIVRQQIALIRKAADAR